ncbi:MAG TPA: MarR family transcriptional regulator [Acidimicrobiales bacterium]|jgi:DNA-binding MarR family transcriptional regulator
MSAESDDTPIPSLMRGARGAYARSTRAHLEAAGIDDLPRNGGFILTQIAYSGNPELSMNLGVSKQAVSQAVDLLVTRGYLRRNADPQDRRRNALELTEQGQLVVEKVQDGCDEVDALLAQEVTAEQITALRKGLHALGEIKSASIKAGRGERRDRRSRQDRQLRSFEPIFFVKDVAAAMNHYGTLGFRTESYDPGYGFAHRDGIGLQLSGHPEHDRGRDGSRAYLFVRDADALYAEWSGPGILGQTEPPGPMPWKMHEGIHTDPDGNVIRFGHPLPEPAAS